MKTQSLAESETERWTASFESRLATEENSFRGIPLNALRDFKGQFIALSGGQIIDHDPNEISLAKRVSSLPEDKFIVIREVTERDLNPARA